MRWLEADEDLRGVPFLIFANKIKAVGYNGTMRNAAREQSHSDFMRDLGKGPNP